MGARGASVSRTEERTRGTLLIRTGQFVTFHAFAMVELAALTRTAQEHLCRHKQAKGSNVHVRQ
jgi:hypothetical protein